MIYCFGKNYEKVVYLNLLRVNYRFQRSLSGLLFYFILNYWLSMGFQGEVEIGFICRVLRDDQFLEDSLKVYSNIEDFG